MKIFLFFYFIKRNSCKRHSVSTNRPLLYYLQKQNLKGHITVLSPDHLRVSIPSSCTCDSSVINSRSQPMQYTMVRLNASNRSRIYLARQLTRIYSPDRSVLSKIREVFGKYNFNNKSGLLQFWMCSACPDSKDNGFNLILMHQPFVSTEDHEGLISYRGKKLDNKYPFVGFDKNVGKWLAGRSAQIRIADHRTRHLVLSPHYQHSAEAEGMGQLVMPVFSYGQGGEEKFEGIIELVTTEPKDSYVEDFEQIQNLLEDLGLKSKYMGKTIKVDYVGKLIRFPLPYSAEFTDLRNEVTKRFQNLEHTNFRIGYKDTNGNLFPISCGEELRVCMAESSSQGAPFVKMYIFGERSSLPYKRKRKRTQCSNIFFL